MLQYLMLATQFLVALLKNIQSKAELKKQRKESKALSSSQSTENISRQNKNQQNQDIQNQKVVVKNGDKVDVKAYKEALIKANTHANQNSAKSKGIKQSVINKTLSKTSSQITKTRLKV